MAQKYHNTVNDMFNMIGLTNSLSSTHEVMDLLKPQPQRFLLTVIDTKIEPATGLWLSNAYVLVIARRAATRMMPAAVYPMKTMVYAWTS